MTGLRAVFNKFSTRMDLFALVVILGFILMAKPVEEIKDIEHFGQYLYLAVGKHGVRVLDIGSNPGWPVEIGAYDTFGTAEALSLQNDGDQPRLYVADGKAGISVYEISPDGSLDFLWRDKTITPARDIAVQNGYALVARGSNGFSSVRVQGDQQSGSSSQFFQVEGIEKALYVAIHLNRAYVIDDAYQMHVLSIDEPGYPLHLTTIPLGYSINDLVIYNGVAYVATDGGGLLLLDLDFPQGNEVITQYKGISNVKSVNVYGAFAFISGGLDGIQVVEISDPRGGVVPVGALTQVEFSRREGPYVAGFSAGSQGGDPIMATIDAQKLVRVGDYVYYADGLRGLRSMKASQIIDIQNPDTFGAAGVDIGWVEDVSLVTEKDENGAVRHNYAYLAGGERGLWIIDVSEPHAPVDITDAFVDKTGGYAGAIAIRFPYVYVAYGKRGIGTFFAGDPRQPVLNNLYDQPWEALDISVVDDRYLYAATGRDGLRIVDIQNKIHPNQIGAEDTPGNAVGVTVLGNLAYVADSGSGLQIIHILDRQKPTLIASADTTGDARAVAVYQQTPSNIYAYIADGSGGVAIFDVSNPLEPQGLKVVETQEFVQDVKVVNTKLFVSERAEGLIIYDLSDPQNPVRMGGRDTPGQAAAVYVAGDYAYIADYNRGLRVINIANPLDPREYGFFDLPTQVRDLTIVANTYGYLVDGTAGLWTVSLEEVDNPIPINFLNTPGEPTAITHDNQYIYVADGSKGLHVVDITTNPVNPTIRTSFDAFERKVDVRDVEVKGSYAYVANGEAGLPVMEISETGSITETSFFGTQGYALNVDVAGNYAYVVSTQGRLDIANIASPLEPTAITPITPMNTILSDTRNVLVVPRREHAYVSDGKNGLFVFDIRQPIKPDLIFNWDTPGVLNDVALAPHYAFLADGEGGVAIIYTPETAVFQTNPDWYMPFRDEVENAELGCKANAQNIEVIPHVIRAKSTPEDKSKGYGPSLLHYFVYVATGHCGLKTFDFTISFSLTPGGLYITPGDATLSMVARGYWLVFRNTIIGLWSQSNVLGLLAMPGAARSLVREQLLALDQRVKDTTWLYTFGIFVFTVGIFYWLALVTHFVMPVRYAREAWQTFQRLLLYFRGMHGQVVVVNDGVADTRELEKNRPGIALVDLNSAVVVEEYPVGGLIPRWIQKRVHKKRRETGETLFQARAEGPGLVFLRTYERIRGVADLRQQIRLRHKVETQTRDGIEVVSSVFILFTLGELPEVLRVTYDGERKPENIRVIATQEEGVPIPGKEGKERQVQKVSDLLDELDPEDKWEIHRTLYRYSLRGEWEFLPEEADQSQRGPFLFDESRVFEAVASKPYDVDDKKTRAWAELPAHVAAGIFRNMVNQEFYDHLFQPSDRARYPMRDLKRAFAIKLRNQGVLAFQYVENQDGSLIKIGQDWEEVNLEITPVREFRTPKPLRARGLKVIYAGFGELSPTHQDVSRYLTRFWQSEWQREAIIKKSEFDSAAIGIRNMARAQAQAAIVNSYSMIFKETTYSQEALALRVLQALEATAADPATKNLLPRDTIYMLGKIHNLLFSGDQEPSVRFYPRDHQNIDPDDV